MKYRNAGKTRRLFVWAALCLWVMICLTPMTSAARADEIAQDITRKCAIRVSEGEKSRLTDGKVTSNWSYEGQEAYVALRLPEQTQAGWLRIEWFYDPTGFELVEYDSDQAELRRRNMSDTFPNIYTLFELLPQTRYIELKLTQPDQKIGTLAVYSRGELPGDVQSWQPPVDKADLMVLSTHQDDELIFLGGTIPYYATALEKPTVVVYMTNCGRGRRAEALNALWKMGVRNYPEFINLKDEKVGSINEGIRLWGGKENILSLLVERIRRFKPEVIVTQDLNGEYGHNQHKITARCAKYAIDAAADPTQFPESYELYGAWQVKKLYHHLYKENAIVMDWTKKLDSLHGYSPLQVAQIGMKEHASQTKYYAVKDHGTYDNSKFGLYFTTVGEDVEKNDFLEHIDPDASSAYLQEHAAEIEAQKAAAAATLAPLPTEPPVQPVETQAPAADAEEPAAPEAQTPSQTRATAEAPAQTPELAASAQKARESGGGYAVLPVLMIAMGVAAIGFGGWCGWRMLRMGRRKSARRRGR